MAELGVGRPAKNRAGPVAGGLAVADPRPVFDGGAVLGVRCTSCRYPAVNAGIPWCPVCWSPVEPAAFEPTGSV